MPMSFPDMKSLMGRAQVRGFRQPHAGEGEDEYREAFATFMRDVDLVESLEIADGRGWDAQGPFALMANLIKAKPEVGDLVDTLRQEYPRITIECKEDPEMLFKHFGQEAQEIIDNFVACSEHTFAHREAGGGVGTDSTTYRFAAAGSRAVVARMLKHSKGKREAHIDTVTSLATRLLVQDISLIVVTYFKH